MPSQSYEPVCADCATLTPPFLNIRRRSLCHDCFNKYVLAKVSKGMELYRFKHQVDERRHRLLLPLSGGVSSLALLHALDVRMKWQVQNRGRTAYDLVLVHVRIGEEGGEEWKQAVQSRFPDHEFAPVVEVQEVLEWDDRIESDLRCLGLVRGLDEDDTALVTRLFVSTKTASAKSDLRELLLQRLVLAVARKHDCEGVLWGHSNSRLAAKALADVAKGRGGSVPNAIANGVFVLGVNVTYPIRDLYKHELELYVDCQGETLSGCFVASDSENSASVSIRNTSIDNLLSDYISSQGVKFPSIMANVVRTTGKLQVMPANEEQRCKLCFLPVTTIPTPTPTRNDLCYGCSRMKQDIKI